MGPICADCHRMKCACNAAGNVFFSLQAKTGYRVLWFTSFKACVNTIMVHTGWKNPGHFKFTPKAGISSEEAAVSGVLAVSDSENASASPSTEKTDKPGTEKAKVKQGFQLNQVHDGLSKVRTTAGLCFQDHSPSCHGAWFYGVF